MALTSASAILTLNVPGVTAGPVQLQGFSADSIFDIGELNAAETSMGIDGRLSAGFVFQEVSQSIELQADSVSNDYFDQWYSAEVQNKRKYVASGTIYLHATSTSYDLSRGFLKTYKPAPDGKKMLSPRKHTIVWESCTPSPQL
jgi:hypothetical protein